MAGARQALSGGGMHRGPGDRSGVAFRMALRFVAAARRRIKYVSLPIASAGAALVLMWPGTQASAADPLTITLQGSHLTAAPGGDVASVTFAASNSSPSLGSWNVMVQTTPVAPLVSFTSSPNAHCSPAGPNLSCLTILAPGDTATYTVEFGPFAPGQVIFGVNALGTGTASAQFPINVPAPPTLQIVHTPSAPLEGGSADLAATVACGPFPCGPLTYLWMVTSQPAGSLAALTSGTSPNPSLGPLSPGAYTVSLTVTDAAGNTSPTVTDTFSVSNVAPTLTVAFSPQSPVTGNLVQLTSTVSDPGSANETYAYLWQVVQQPAGSTIQLSSTTATSTSFTPITVGSYTFQLTVTDSGGLSVSSTLLVGVADCGCLAPTIVSLSHTPVGPMEGGTIGLAAVVSCGVCQGSSYKWSIDSKPAGSQAALSSPTSATPSFIGDTTGLYTVSLVVTDALGNSSAVVTDTIIVINVPPTPNIVITPQDPVTGTLVQLTGAYTDPGCTITFCNETYTFDWQLYQQPAGSTTQLSSTTTINTGFTADKAGTYGLRFRVTDSGGLTTALTTTVTVHAPIAVQGASGSAAEGTPFIGTVATFSDGDFNADSSAYKVTINWGDGTTGTPVAVVFDPSIDGFIVTGSHVYAEEGTYAVQVSIADSDGDSAAATSSIGVADPPVSATPVSPITQNEGVAGQSQTLATFTDPGGPEAVSDYTATVDWGDGSAPSPGTISGSGSTFAVSGAHRYAEEGVYTITVAIVHDGIPSIPVTIGAHVFDPAVIASGETIAGVEGVTTSPQVVATFTDPGGAENLSDYTALINWGDGSPLSPGAITYDSSALLFVVQGSHNFDEEGTYTVAVYITHDGVGPVRVESTATIADQPVVPSLRSVGTVNGVEGANTAPQIVANFTDPAGAETPQDYTAYVDWGDGKPATLETITVDSSGVFSVVAASHTYAEEGQYQLTITVSHGGTETTLSNRADIADVAIVATPAADISPSPQEAKFASRMTLATYTDPGGAEAISSYSASINWGDGTPSSTGDVVADFFTGIFSVLGSHQYAEEGTYNVTVTITHQQAGTVVVTVPVTVDDQAVTSKGFNLVAWEGTPTGPTVVATFTDPAGAEPVDSYLALIDWGDGSNASPGQITAGAGGVFTVTGNHTYREELPPPGKYQITVFIGHEYLVDQAFSSATVLDLTVNGWGGYLVTGNEGGMPVQTVGFFSDPAGTEALGDYQANIDWGDGSVTPGIIVPAPIFGGFWVMGSHQYSEEGVYTVVFTVAHDSAVILGGGVSTAVIDDTPVVSSGDLTVSGLENQATGMQAVAKFVDPGTPEPLSDYSATIDWGDGSAAAAGVIAYDPATRSFTVSGNHTYADEGLYAVKTKIVHDGLSPVEASSTAVIGDPAVVGTGGFALEGVERTGAVQTVATFTDPAGPEAVGDYSASIDWGDGGPPTAGTITLQAGVFTVTGAHAYANEGSYAVKVSISHDAAPAVVVSDTATISDSDQLIGTTLPIHPVENATFTGAVATFSNTDTSAPASDFTALIGWGDGTTSAGTVSGGAGSFTVSGSHLYDEGRFVITVTLSDVGGVSATATRTIDIREADHLRGRLTAAFAPAEGQAFSGAVATFTDVNTANGAADFTATIDWGDGTRGPGVVSGGSGSFTVSGDHTYAEAGFYIVRVSLADNAPGTARATALGFIHVADYALTATGTTLGGQVDTTFSAVVANFTDADPVCASTEYLALIDWGDGDFTLGTVGGANPFSVTGTHRYESAGVYHVKVYVLDGGFATTTADTTITVA